MRTPATVVRFQWLDLLRVICAVAVMVWHYQHFYPEGGARAHASYESGQPFAGLLWPFYSHGYLAVNVFWAISGCVFAFVYNNAAPKTSDFIANRVARLYPLHLLTLCMVAALQAVHLAATHEYFVYVKNDAWHFGLQLAMVSHWGFQVGDSFNAPIWSVSLEVFIYIVFWLVVLSRGSRFTATHVSMLLLFSLLHISGVPGPFWECGAYFFAGSTLAALAMKSSNAAQTCVQVAVICFVAAVASRLIDAAQAGWISTLFAIAALVASTLAIDFRFPYRRWKAFSVAGDLTYGVYLLHFPMQILFVLLMLVLGLSDADRLSVVNSGMFMLAWIASVLVAAAVTYRRFEAPLRDYIRRRLPAFLSPHAMQRKPS